MSGKEKEKPGAKEKEPIQLEFDFSPGLDVAKVKTASHVYTGERNYTPSS